MLLLSILLATAPLPAQADDGGFAILAEIIIRAPELSRAEHKIAKEFARCMSLPRMPTEDEFEGVEWKCSLKLPTRIKSDLQKILTQIRETVREHPGSEASLTVSRAKND